MEQEEQEEEEGEVEEEEEEEEEEEGAGGGRRSGECVTHVGISAFAKCQDVPLSQSTLLSTFTVLSINTYPLKEHDHDQRFSLAYLTDTFVLILFVLQVLKQTNKCSHRGCIYPGG